MTNTNQSESGAIQLDGAAATLVASAVELVAYGCRDIETLELVATLGWPADLALDDDSFELRCAIQDEAKRVLATVAL